MTLFPDSMLAHMFSGRHEDSLDRDASGNVFFDYSPALMVRCLLLPGRVGLRTWRSIVTYCGSATHF